MKKFIFNNNSYYSSLSELYEFVDNELEFGCKYYVMYVSLDCKVFADEEKYGGRSDVFEFSKDKDSVYSLNDLVGGFSTFRSDNFLSNREWCDCACNSVGCFNIIKIYFVKNNIKFPSGEAKKHNYFLDLISNFEGIDNDSFKSRMLEDYENHFNLILPFLILKT